MPLIAGIATEIGRGHTHYLNCVWELLKQKLPPTELIRFSVFDSDSSISRAGWQFLRGLYHYSGRHPFTRRLYTRLRQHQSSADYTTGLGAVGRRLLNILGAGLRKRLQNFPGIGLVEHQLTARILSDVCRTWFIHADIAAPAECACFGPERIFVPVEWTAQRFLSWFQLRLQNRLSPPSVSRLPEITCTGLMIEPALTIQAAQVFAARSKRLLNPGQPLCVAFFSSGAYPAEHTGKILSAIESVIARRMTVLLFCGISHRFYATARHRLQHLSPTENTDVIFSNNPGQLVLIRSANWCDEARITAQLLPCVDVFVAPTHERVNWALGLGLPLFALFPMIGSHAQMNYEFCLEQQVACAIRTNQDAWQLGQTLAALHRSGRLAEMAQNGFGRLPITGAQETVETILTQLGGTGDRRSLAV